MLQHENTAISTILQLKKILWNTNNFWIVVKIKSIISLSMEHIKGFLYQDLSGDFIDDGSH